MSRREKAKRAEESAPPVRLSEEDRLRAAALTVALFFGVALFVFFGVFGGVRIYSLVGRWSGEPSAPPKAVIVDQLSLTAPNPSFAKEATEMLERAGYTVDYFPGEEVTVQFYRDLPTHGYDFIILRVHSARYRGTWRNRPLDMAELFTSEPYTPTAHVEEQRLGRVGAVGYDEVGTEAYFGIGPRFVTEGMRGEFDDATLIMMGCNGLTTATTAEAFIRKGAKTFISWSDFVSASHTDAATLSLLERLVIDGLSIEDAVAQTMAEVGPDPAYDSVLLSYPPEG